MSFLGLLEIAIGTSVAVIFWFIVGATIGYFIDKKNRSIGYFIDKKNRSK